MKMKNHEIIEKLISIGHEVDGGFVPSDLSSLERCDHINRISKKAWSEEASRLTLNELIALLKGLTYVECKLKWLGGSAAGAIWLFAELLKRSVKVEIIDAVTSWIIESTNNPYVPFGTTVSLGARNYSEYKKLSDERNALIQEAIARDKEFEEEAERQRKERKERRILGAQSRGKPARELLIQKLNAMPIRDQLILISRDEVHAPTYYPTKCADSAKICTIKSLPVEAGHALVQKLKGKHRGPWGAFKKRLTSVFGTENNKEPWRI